MSPAARETCQGYRIQGHGQLLCHLGREVHTRQQALLVCAVRDLDSEILGWPTVRATFQASAIALMLYHSGHSSVGEDMELAELEPDNIYRGRWSTVR
ncbi:hypothetical protein BDW42DRAFT_179455 [Aspergillus taichungensis]|uniref:Uncharacterized protein n=1 Tax=Aspergillus taichungensis TaxID=482145 RepID=A0A2J5HGK3_9EURO|nr:hypothetical protein BDW42DRAFT_179455 [Aspergillus taichungensis]